MGNYFIINLKVNGWRHGFIGSMIYLLSDSFTLSLWSLDNCQNCREHVPIRAERTRGQEEILADGCLSFISHTTQPPSVLRESGKSENLTFSVSITGV